MPANEHLDLKGTLSCITISLSAVPVCVAKSEFAICKTEAIGVAAMACLPPSDQSAAVGHSLELETGIQQRCQGPFHSSQNWHLQ